MISIHRTDSEDQSVAGIPMMPHILLLTGAPGIGKTTVVRTIADALTGIRLCGFYTDELRERGVRQGFRLVSFDGNLGIIAHVEIPRHPRVGKYGVDVVALNRLSRKSLARREECTLYLVDEIGKMECLSSSFVAAIRALFLAHQPLVATIALKGSGFIQEVKARRDVELWEVNRANRDLLPAEVFAWLGKHGITDHPLPDAPPSGPIGGSIG